MAISLSNRSCPYEFNASVACWLKTTSHYNVIAPLTVSTTQNAKLLTSRNLCHSLMLCHVTRSQRMGSVKHFGDPAELVEPSRLRRNRRSCRKWIRRDPLWSHIDGLAQWASCQIRKIAGCACRERFLHHRVMHAPWCIAGSLTTGFLWSRWRRKRSRHTRCMHNPQIYVSGKRPISRLPQWARTVPCQVIDAIDLGPGLY